MKSVKIALSAAHHWESEKNYSWAVRNYDTALFILLHDSVKQFDNARDGTNFLKENECCEILEKTLKSYEFLVEKIRSDQLPSSVIGGNFHLGVLAHLSWLLRRFEEAKQFIEYANDPGFRSTSFLGEYSRGLAALIGNKPYQPQIMKLRSLERYWWEYLLLISDFTNDRDPSDSIDSVKNSFIRKNRDRRLEDNYDIEGTGKHPVRWDFRLASILEFASEYYGYAK